MRYRVFYMTLQEHEHVKECEKILWLHQLKTGHRPSDWKRTAWSCPTCCQFADLIEKLGARAGPPAIAEHLTGPLRADPPAEQAKLF